MYQILRLTIAAVAVAFLSFPASVSAQIVATQIKLTEKHVEGFVAAESRFGAAASSVVTQLEKEHFSSELAQHPAGGLDLESAAVESVHQHRDEPWVGRRRRDEESAELDAVFGSEKNRAHSLRVFGLLAVRESLRLKTLSRLRKPGSIGSDPRPDVASLVAPSPDGASSKNSEQNGHGHEQMESEEPRMPREGPPPEVRSGPATQAEHDAPQSGE